MNISRTEVSAELGLGLVSPENIIVPLMAALSYTSADPYAVRMAFDVGTDEAVEWTLARDLLAAALHAREGIGDVQAWPSATSCDPAAGIVPARADGAGADGHGADGAGGHGADGAGGHGADGAGGYGILNIAMSSPFGQAQFEVSARAIGTFLERTYQVVPAGQESGYLDFDAELTELLSQA
jgi:hypothetical protein